ncbi:MAG TPA: cytochrome b N-terminal domain-containing protein [Streptosporangiaceae bacterium]|jgi:quinol-cytochrome oxidoreductase complex cytochrome b subunit|nr:cytochrome b N-terminal domain-containing protein [Streptosporangiaceae bacterium]
MSLSAFIQPGSQAIDLNGSSHLLHWSFIDISVANLIVIAVMVVIFGAALIIRFPHRAGADTAPDDRPSEAAVAAAAADPGDAGMWTAKVRTKAAQLLPPKKLLPDRQPAYVSSWIYVFGVASLVALGIVIASGFALALGGSDWWHTNSVGHFFNSVHLWSVELFMAFLVIHLWGKFWMAAWRGRRAMTWITGVIAFGASIVTAFTGYLSQQNFDSQWIATNGKDAFNAVGIGSIWNAMNFGQMFMWHIVLMPLVLLAIIGAHILLVRMRGVSHPLPERRVRGRAERKAAAAADAGPWRGPNRRYDILKEGAVATLVVGALTVVMAGVLSSPDVPPVTMQTWGKVAPVDLVYTAATELNGTSGTATYGPPYNNGTGGVQQVGPVNWQKVAGITQPINAAHVFVLDPLSSLAKTTPPLATALAAYNSATPAQQNKWATAYVNSTAPGAKKMPFRGGNLKLPAAGPVPVMMSYELAMARSGSLDSDLLAQRQFYGTDFTKPLLFIADGAYYNNLADKMNLTGDQWGVMNETGNYPGQPWLWLYQMWYHVSPFQNSGSVDIWAVYLTGIGTILLLLVPFIPGLRDIPRVIPVYRLIWRSWYRSSGKPVDPERPAETRPTPHRV